jgi:hypothetical protein
MESSLEIWKSYPGYESIYEISNHGRLAVITPDGRKLRKLNNKTHYLSASLKSIDGQKPKTSYIHKDVARVFIGPRPDFMVVRHLDGNRFNNHVSNLCYGTPEENYADTKKHKVHQGEKNGRAKLNENKVKIIKFLLANQVAPKEIAIAFDVDVMSIYAIKQNRNWTHVQSI